MNITEHEKLHALGIAHSHEETEHTELHAHSHDHDHGHSHGGHHHVHSEAEKKAVINRLSRAIGHLQSIKTMVETDRDCSEVLIQLAAVKSAVNNTGKLVLKEHIAHCIVDAVESGDNEAVESLNQAIDRFMR